jgi:hypothetical protein
MTAQRFSFFHTRGMAGKAKHVALALSLNKRFDRAVPPSLRAAPGQYRRRAR